MLYTKGRKQRQNIKTRNIKRRNIAMFLFVIDLLNPCDKLIPLRIAGI